MLNENKAYIKKLFVLMGVLLCAAATTACASQLRQSVYAGREIKHNMAKVYGESKTRAEVDADLVLWKRAGLDKFRRGRGSQILSSPNTKLPMQNISVCVRDLNIS